MKEPIGMLDYITLQYGPTKYGTPTPSHFKLLNGELVETVDVLDDGTPDWDSAGPCDATGDVALQLRLIEVLKTDA
jgi:hypothetical protein